MPIARPNWWRLQAAQSNHRAVKSCRVGNGLKKGEEEEEVKAEESQSQRPLREMISELFEHLKTQSLKSLLHKKGKEERKGCRDKKR